MLLGKFPINPIIPIDPVGTITRTLAKRMLRDISRARVTPVKGSIVLCDLVLGEYHSGVYIGDHEIVNLEGDGRITVVSPEDFLFRIGGLNNAKAIYVSCDEDGEPVGSSSVAIRALSKIGKTRNYNLLFDNCHQFTSGCITGDFESSDNFTMMLKMTAKDYLGAEKWLLWDEYDDVNDGVLSTLENLNIRKSFW
ncbi:MAG: hypothetical protein ACOYIS_05785 [Candidatus Cloacimonadaceae bacterium]|jgi:hypothetical protein